MVLIDDVTNYWKLDESSGAVLDAHSTVDGTNTGATTGVTGFFGTGYDLDAASSDHIDLDSDISLTGEFTLSWWAKPTNTRHHICADTTGGFSRFYRDSNVTAFVVVNTAGSNQQISVTLTSSASTYVMYSVTRNSSNLVTYYENAVSKGTVTLTGTVVINSFGRPPTASSIPYMDGVLDEIFLSSDTDVGSSGITELYASGDGLAYPFSAATLRKIKISGTFVDKPILTKVSGSFVDKPIKIKVGGTFVDA